MPLATVSAFVAGFATGWASRSLVGSTREALVQTIVVAHKARENVKRVVAEQVEWVEDMFAEGRARYEAQRDEVALDDYVPPPPVVDIKKRRGHAA
jgi:hypothetical protein